jgi:hypothetical protein
MVHPTPRKIGGLPPRLRSASALYRTSPQPNTSGHAAGSPCASSSSFKPVALIKAALLLLLLAVTTALSFSCYAL